MVYVYIKNRTVIWFGMRDEVCEHLMYRGSNTESAIMPWPTRTSDVWDDFLLLYWTHEQCETNPCWLMIAWNYITQDIGDYNHPIEESPEKNQGCVANSGPPAVSKLPLSLTCWQPSTCATATSPPLICLFCKGNYPQRWCPGPTDGGQRKKSSNGTNFESV